MLRMKSCTLVTIPLLRGCRGRELVRREFRGVHHIKMYRPDRTVREHAVGRRHIAGRDRMQHRRHADDRRRLTHMGANRILPHVGMLVNLRQRTVITNRAVEHKWHVVLDTVVNNAAVDALALDERRMEP